MPYFLSFFFSYILLYKYITLVSFVFIGTFLIPLPLNIMFFVVGAFSSQGYFNVFVCWIVAFLTNVLSDLLGFFLTNKYGEEIFKTLHIDTKNPKFLKIEKWLMEYSSETIFFTRITGPFAPTVNFLSGLVGVPFKKFLLYDIAGNFVDVSFFIFAGYFLGNFWQDFLKNTQYISLFIFLVFILFLLFRFYKKKLSNILK